MLFSIRSGRNGFTLVELVIVIVILGILAAVAIPRLFGVTAKAEEAATETMISSLESALTIYVSKQYLSDQPIAVHNPFDDLSNVPKNYNGSCDPVTPLNTPDGTWSWRPSGNWIMYNPRTSIAGGWLNDGERFIIFQVQPVVDGADTVGLRLSTTPAYVYSW